MEHRCHRYLSDLFARVQRETGRREITFPYFYEVICCGNEFTAALEYIVEGSKEENFFETRYIQIAAAVEGLHTRVNMARGGQPVLYNVEAELAALAQNIQSDR